MKRSNINVALHHNDFQSLICHQRKIKRSLTSYLLILKELGLDVKKKHSEKIKINILTVISRLDPNILCTINLAMFDASYIFAHQRATSKQVLPNPTLRKLTHVINRFFKICKK